MTSTLLAKESKTFEADIVIYGATPSGIMAAVSGARLGKSVILLEQSRWIGGTVAGGLSATDVGFAQVISGLTQEFFSRTNKIEKAKGANPNNNWVLEPHVATQVFFQMLNEAAITPKLKTRIASIDKTGTKINSLSTTNGDVYKASVFIDATYEGDLMAKAASYTWGRESQSQYNEKDAGTQTPEKVWDIDATLTPGDLSPDAPVLPTVSNEAPAPKGSADKHIMAYNYRHCATTNLSNAISYTRLAPADYDRKKYLGVQRIIEFLRLREKLEGEAIARVFFSPARKKTGELNPYANNKFDINGGTPFGTNVIMLGDSYVEGDEKTRERVRKEIASYNQGLLHYLASDKEVPQDVRDFMNQFGACADEFVYNYYFPTQMYIREARRMIGEYVMLEQNVLLQRRIEDPIALAGYNVDTHQHRMFNIKGKLWREGFKNAEGYTSSMVDFCTPFGISYKSLTPKSSEVTNLLVSVTISASAVANYALRLEPQYMMMGQAAATAASLAIDSGSSVQDISYVDLRKKLLEGRQLLDTVEDFLVMKVCVDKKDAIIYGLSPKDAACKVMRQIRSGERLPYHLTPVNTKNPSQCIVDIHDNIPLVYNEVNRIVSATSMNYDICTESSTNLKPKTYQVIGNNKEYGFQMGEWNSTEGGAGIITGGVSERCRSVRESGQGAVEEMRNSRRYFEYKNISRSVVPPLGERSYQKFRTVAYGKSGFDNEMGPFLLAPSNPCPYDDGSSNKSDYRPTLTFWAHTMFAFGSRENPLAPADAVVSDLYIGHSSPELGQVMERTYWAKDFGKLRVEMWHRSDWSRNGKSALEMAREDFSKGNCSMPYSQKDTPTIKFSAMSTNDESAYSQEILDTEMSKHTWYLTSCRDFSDVVIAKNPAGDEAPSGFSLPGRGNTPAPLAKFWDFWAK